MGRMEKDRPYQFLEAVMKTAPLLILGVLIAWPQDDDEVKRSLAAIAKADGKVVYDEKAPGRPVISVDL